MDLSVQIGSLRLANPLMAASGCFGYGVEYADAVDLASLGAVVSKGLFIKERSGHPPQRIVETPSGMLNAIGLQGIGVHRYIKEKLPELRRLGATNVINICGSTLDEYVELARILSDAEGVHALELNISCPNIKEGGITFGCSLHGTFDVVAAVKKVTHLPVIPEADAQRHRRRLDRQGGRRRRRRRGLARQHLPRHGHRRRDAAAEAVEHRRRPERPGDPADCRAHGLRVPARGEDSGHRHGRDRHGDRRARVHDRGRHGRAGRHGQLRRSVHLVEAARRHARLHAAPPARRASPTWSARSTTTRGRSSGSAPSRARRRARRPRAAAGRAVERPRRRREDRQPAVHPRRPRRWSSASPTPARASSSTSSSTTFPTRWRRRSKPPR